MNKTGYFFFIACLVTTAFVQVYSRKLELTIRNDDHTQKMVRIRPCPGAKKIIYYIGPQDSKNGTLEIPDGRLFEPILEIRDLFQEDFVCQLHEPVDGGWRNLCIHIKHHDTPQITPNVVRKYSIAVINLTRDSFSLDQELDRFKYKNIGRFDGKGYLFAEVASFKDSSMRASYYRAPMRLNLDDDSDSFDDGGREFYFALPVSSDGEPGISVLIFAHEPEEWSWYPCAYYYKNITLQDIRNVAATSGFVRAALESKVCLREIDTFLETNGTEHQELAGIVLALIAEVVRANFTQSYSWACARYRGTDCTTPGRCIHLGCSDRSGVEDKGCSDFEEAESCGLFDKSEDDMAAAVAVGDLFGPDDDNW